ncbi:hypothetical protein Zm00014a_039814 [Zea mays]|uniref:BED-type domain-containing protein n=1 Tax=Zea mays TaxID=4577 RepID=A0A3L6EQH0_MAIZE|nr:hypothetical protein Zm00014a_039814 [Zea mays]
MSSAASNPSAQPAVDKQPLKRNSDDIGWEYGTIVNPNDWNVIKCKLCPMVVKAGIYRLKLHIAGRKGQVRACPNATQEDRDKCSKALDDSRKAKIARLTEKQEVIDAVADEMDVNDDTGLDDIGSSQPRTMGPMDKFTMSLDSNSLGSTQKNLHQQKISEHAMKERFNHIHAKRRIRAQKNKKADPLVATDATFAQGWMVDGAKKDEEGSDVEPVTGLTWKLIAETCGAEEVTKLRRSARLTVEREVEDTPLSETESEEEAPQEEDVDFESDQDDVITAGYELDAEEDNDG